jgi:dihydroorotase
LHTQNVYGPVFDLATTISKFLYLGLSLDDIIAKVTSAPARVIGKDDIGTLRVGAWGDAVLVEQQQGTFEFSDSRRETRQASQRLEPVLVIRAGRVYDGPALDYRPHHHPHFH